MRKINKIAVVSLMASTMLSMTSCDDLFEPAIENHKTPEELEHMPTWATGLLGHAYISIPYGSGDSDWRYVVHRIISLDGDRVTLMGDGNLALHEYCNRGDVCAKVSLVVKPNGKKRSLDSFLFRFFAKVWFALLPFRRYLLWIYNKVN